MVPAGVGDVVEVAAYDDAVGGVAQGGGGALDDFFAEDVVEGAVEVEAEDALGVCPVLGEEDGVAGWVVAVWVVAVRVASGEVEAVCAVEGCGDFGWPGEELREPIGLVGFEVEDGYAAQVVGDEDVLAVGEWGGGLRGDEVGGVDGFEVAGFEAVEDAALAVGEEGVAVGEQRHVGEGGVGWAFDAPAECSCGEVEAEDGGFAAVFFRHGGEGVEGYFGGPDEVAGGVYLDGHHGPAAGGRGEVGCFAGLGYAQDFVLENAGDEEGFCVGIVGDVFGEDVGIAQGEGWFGVADGGGVPGHAGDDGFVFAEVMDGGEVLVGSAEYGVVGLALLSELA